MNRSGVSVQIHAGEHDRRDCPVGFAATDLPEGPLWLVDAGSGQRTPLQRLGDEAVAIVNDLPRGKAATFQVEVGEPVEGVVLREGHEAIEVLINGAPFTTYRYAADEVRPYFYPLLGPGGLAMTRNYPMSEVEGESRDHPHHRSLYVAFGEVNGVDVWAEPPNPNAGRIVHRGWDSISAGPVAAELREQLQWIDSSGNPLLNERRRIRAYATRALRLLDLEIVLSPARHAVFFGDTKEGGPLAVRMASSIEGARGGLIENAYGGRCEAETWGKRAPWVDYSGPIRGTRAGLAIMDHPTSFRHPTYWHVRDYGLFAANPFGASAFTGDPRQRGDFVLPPGESVAFRYRVCLHQGDAQAARVADHYHDFANPPMVREG